MEPLWVVVSYEFPVLRTATASNCAFDRDVFVK
jgi:hypothetical protein